MSSGNNSNCFEWQEFYVERGSVLTPSKKAPFLKNFAIMDQILADYFGTSHWSLGKSFLEIGAGRGTMSDLFNKVGCKTTCTDQFEHLVGKDERSNVHRYIQHDIIKDVPLDEKFDIILTYGLLEHFKTEHKIRILMNCSEMKSNNGIEIHYVVPSKFTNWNESGAVYRDPCHDLYGLGMEGYRRGYGLVHVFPYFKRMNWVTSKFFSKGFIMWNGSKYEYPTNTGIGNG